MGRLNGLLMIPIDAQIDLFFGVDSLSNLDSLRVVMNSGKLSLNT
jgi:hypothetical protein